MSAAAPPVGRARGRAQPRTERRSLRLLRIRSRLLSYAAYAIAVAAIVRVALPPAPAPRPAPPPPPATPGTDLSAEGFAVDFARAYLTYDAASPQARETLLAPFVGQGSSALDQDAGVQLPDQGSDRVRFAQVVAQGPGAGGTRYTVQADTSADGTMYLAVTVTRSTSGALELVGTPAVVGAPMIAGPVADPAQNGQQVSDPAVSTVVSRAVTHYLQGDGQDLQPDLANGTSVPVPNATLSRIQVEQIAWLDQGRSVGVDVQASDRAGATYTLHYTISLAQQPSAGGGSRWFVSSIESRGS
jgi:hypothetical protein